MRKDAEFDEDTYSFRLLTNPFPNENIHQGPYMILRSQEGQKKSDIHVPDDTNIFRIGHKLAQRILTACKEEVTPVKELVFNYTNTPTKITLLANFIGQKGWFQAQHLSINSFEYEDYLLLACYTEAGEIIDAETSARFFSIAATEQNEIELPADVSSRFKELIFKEQQEVVSVNANRNRDFFDEEMDKLEQWATDMKISLEKEIRDLDAEIKLRKAEAKKQLNLETKVKAQRQIKELEKRRSEKRQTLFVAQDDIDEKKEVLLTDIEKMLSQKIELKELFTFKWRMV